MASAFVVVRQCIPAFRKLKIYYKLLLSMVKSQFEVEHHELMGPMMCTAPI